MTELLAEHETQRADPAALLAGYGRAQLWFALTVVVLLSIAVLVPWLGLSGNALWLSFFFFGRQDEALLVFLLLPLLLGPQIGAQQPAGHWRMISRPMVIAVISLALCGLCWAGHYLVLRGVDLTSDEQMANFDAYIFSHGHIFWPISPPWRPFAAALNQKAFILTIGSHEGWMSFYLPINAALRAAVGVVADPNLTSPLLVALGLFALWRIASRLWSDSPSTQGIALIIFVGSSQVIFTGMTAFAMTAHLVFNLIWLDLFLRDRKVSHVGAILVGFLATGLHQPLFHPLFVLPFIGLLISQRRWRLAAIYGATYAAICAFWFIWPVWVSSHGVGPVPPHAGLGVDYLTRLRNLVQAPNFGALWLMALNLIRFAVWQHLLLMPLLIFGIWTSWRGDALARALAAGFFLPIPVMLILLPEQGFGWGYRYLHPVIGNACLLAAYGWHALRQRGLSLERALLWTSAGTFLLILPVHAYMANRLAAPGAVLERKIAQSRADLEIVEDGTTVAAKNLVINRPDLSNRPIRLLASELQPANMAGLCAFGSVTFFDDAQLRSIREFFGQEDVKKSSHGIALEQAARLARCVVIPVGQAVPGVQTSM